MSFDDDRDRDDGERDARRRRRWEREFTDEEISRIRRMLDPSPEDREREKARRDKIDTMLQEHERSRWLWGFIGKTSFWVGAVIAAVITTREFLLKMAKALLGP